jgi:CRP-like cAMP-binding protein
MRSTQRAGRASCNGANKPGIEVGIIGREGMTGLSVLMGGHDRATHDTYMQAGGSGQRLPVAALRDAIAINHSLHQYLLRYAHSFLIQTATTVLANGRSKLEERLARWLLMADDRLDGDELSLTHEFLGLMLGTHRPGVTNAVSALEKAVSLRRAAARSPSSIAKP